MGPGDRPETHADLDGLARGRPTSFDIAYLAGVSQPTVSRALSGSPLVSETTRRRITEIARQLNYRVDKNASSLRRGQTRTLALLFFDDASSDPSSINPFFLGMLGSVTRVAANRGYDLLVSFQQLSTDWHRDYEEQRRADGILLLGYGDFTLMRDRLDRLVAAGTHFVRWGHVEDGQPGLAVGSDNMAGGRLAGSHLLNGGRRRIAYLGHTTDQYPEFRDRYLGLVASHTQAGQAADPRLVAPALSSEADGEQAIARLIEGGQHFDALFAASDLIALGAMRALVRHGLAVPDDVAVVGFDDIPAASLAAVPLTTIAQDTRAAGVAMVDGLLDLIAGTPPESRCLPVSLVVRQSCGASPKA
jgi:DNA-binding LacI/PurR family transcriptional regulator